ncbi:effector-associated constant component EACC1 [Streptosporangium saharense]|uniref:Uncharacterized protein n=1 Tax=Streptosporangium saharense TaxID=1706840 RepID=A0A7W7VQM9_9ACTN|nr:hypothetical protein [Streptosporangium saharense]MBB4918898.1 hypothetical protein [Streptosporangium saharense]
MDALVQVSGDDEITEFTELRGWLSGDRALTGRTRVVRQPPGEGELGGALDTLVVTLGSGSAGIALVRALTTWLRTRRADVTITVTSPSGTVELNAQRVRDTAVLSLLEEILRDGDEEKPQDGDER